MMIKEYKHLIKLQRFSMEQMYENKRVRMKSYHKINHRYLEVNHGYLEINRRYLETNHNHLEVNRGYLEMN